MVTPKIRRGIALLVAAGALLLTAASQAEAQTIYACVKKKSGTARFVSKHVKCKKGETKLSWSMEGPPGKDGTNGAPGTNGAAGVEGKIGPQGPSTVYEVELSATSSFEPKETPVTITLSNLPPGAYAIFGKGSLGPVEDNGGSGYCELNAGSDRDNSFFPLSATANYIVGISTELTHTFTSTGSVAMTCTTFLDEFVLWGGETRIVAIMVGSQSKSTATAST
jgi:uncharacterized protein (DUF2141 family)